MQRRNPVMNAISEREEIPARCAGSAVVFESDRSGRVRGDSDGGCWSRAAKVITLFLLMVRCAVAAEIDSITPRKVELDNAINAVNSIFNQRLAEGVDNANRRAVGQSCNEQILYVELRKSIYQSYTASWGLKGYALDKQLRELLRKYSYSLSLNDSIYRDLDYLEAFSLNLKELSDLVNIDGHLIGLDKIGHFFAEGWRYFSLTSDEGYDLEGAISWGREQEKGKFGYATTGIYSFADLTANLNGWFFWNRVLLKNDNPLAGVFGTLFDRPYVSCDLQIWQSIRQQQLIHAWVYNHSFDFADYIDGAWDEGNNCNSYQDPIIEEKVESRIRRVAPKLSCPLAKESCLAARTKYGDYSRYLLHPVCLSVQ